MNQTLFQGLYACKFTALQGAPVLRESSSRGRRTCPGAYSQPCRAPSSPAVYDLTRACEVVVLFPFHR